MRVSHKAFGIILLALLPATLAAQSQNFVYTNDNNPSGNTVSAFSVDSNGTLAMLTSCPMISTGGNGVGGGFYASSGIIVVNSYLYVANAGSNNISQFTVDPTTGCLTADGSPVATGGTAGNDGMSLAATPGGTYLYAGSAQSKNITIFKIGSGGALTALGSPSSPVSLDGEPAGMKVSPDGGYLIVAEPLMQTLSSPTIVNKIAVFSIDSTSGALTAVQGSPFSGSGTEAAGVAVNCSSNQLFVGNPTSAAGQVDVYSFPPSGGSLSLIGSSPLVSSAASTGVVALSPNGSELFISNQKNSPTTSDSISVFTVGSGGTLTLVSGSPFGSSVGVGGTPGGLATDQAGTFLYSANKEFLTGATSSTISSLNIGAGGVLSATSGSPLADPNSTALESLAAYPPATCSSSPTPSTVTGSFSARLKIRPPGFDLMGTFTPGQESSVNPLANPVTVQVGPSFSFTIPAGSFSQLGAGAGAGIYVFSGTPGGVPVQARIQVLPNGSSLIKLDVSTTSLTGLPNPVSVNLSIGSNSGAADVTALFVPGGQ